MEKVTKGEWVVGNYSGSLSVECNGVFLLDKYACPEYEANAHLMAASKELLEALELLLYGWDNEDLQHDVSGSFEIARGAINKAKNINP